MWWSNLRLVALFGVLLLAGCGFQLRGNSPLVAGLDAVALRSTDPNSDLSIELERALKQSSAWTDADGAAVLSLSNEALNRQILSYNERARVSEYTLVLTVDVVLQRGDDVLQPGITLSVEREYGFDENQALAAAKEEELITRELRRQMVQQILEHVRQAPVQR